MSEITPFLGLRTCIYRVDNLTKAVEWYASVLRKPPYFSEKFYAGFDVGGYELGLLPAENKGNTGDNQAAYWGVEDIRNEFDRLLSLGAKSIEEPHDVGSGILVARVADPWSNILGIIFNPHFMKTPPEPVARPRVTGLGGVFFKSDNPEKLKQWYEKHLGIPDGKYGASFEWRSATAPDRKGFTAWSIMNSSTTYFDPGKQQAMINYRVNDLQALLKKLSDEGIQVVGEPEEYDYGKFGWIMDPDGNKIELWEPVDEVYNTIAGDRLKT